MERAIPLANVTGPAVILRSLVDLKLASILCSLYPVLPTLSGELLEIDCGNQPYRFLFRNVTYRGFESTRAAVFAAPPADVTYYAGDTFPIASESQDVVFHTEVLEHVERPGAFLAECARVLKPGGTILFTVPFSYRFHYVPYDYFRFTPSALRMLLEQAGFTSIELVPQGTDVTTICHKILALAYRWVREDVPVLWRLVRFLVILLSLPLLAGVHVLGLVSLCGLGSPDDPLGYRVTASKF